MQSCFTVFIAAALAATLAVASPAPAKTVEKRLDNPNPNEQACACRESYIANPFDSHYGENICDYNLIIGVDISTVDCNKAIQGLASIGGWNYACGTGGNGFTTMGFSMDQGNQNALNSYLGGQYPMVNGFNCPGN